jgi:hypothetical protein
VSALDEEAAVLWLLPPRGAPWFVAITLLCACSAPAVLPGAPASPLPVPSFAPPACAEAWASTETSVPALSTAPTTAVDVGTDTCADRVEFVVDGPAAGYWVSYVDAVVQDGSGAELPVPGGARLQVQLHHPSYDQSGQATLPARAGAQLADVAGYPTLRSVVFGGSFEGYSTFGVGVRARLPFRVSTMDGPGSRSRIVLEVAHRWP